AIPVNRDGVAAGVCVPGANLDGNFICTRVEDVLPARRLWSEVELNRYGPDHVRDVELVSGGPIHVKEVDMAFGAWMHRSDRQRRASPRPSQRQPDWRSLAYRSL